MKTLLRFSLYLTVLELFLAGILLSAYIWIESQLCPPEHYDSGHCYAAWFSIFEQGFYLLALSLFFISPMYLIKKCVSNVQATYYRWFLSISYVLLGLFLWWSNWLFLWQVLLVMLFAKITQHYLLKKVENSYEK